MTISPLFSIYELPSSATCIYCLSLSNTFEPSMLIMLIPVSSSEHTSSALYSPASCTITSYSLVTSVYNCDVSIIYLSLRYPTIIPTVEKSSSSSSCIFFRSLCMLSELPFDAPSSPVTVSSITFSSICSLTVTTVLCTSITLLLNACIIVS